MEKLNKALWADYDQVSDIIKVANVEDSRYKDLLDERDKIRNEILKLEQSAMEIEVKKNQMAADDKREKVRNQITIGTFVVSTSISVYAILKTFKFDQTGTVTSTLGRGILNGVLPKFKR